MTRADWTDTVIEVLFTEAVQAGFHFFLCLANTSENKTKPFHGIIIGPRESYQLRGARESIYLNANEVCKEWSFRGVHTAAPILKKRKLNYWFCRYSCLKHPTFTFMRGRESLVQKYLGGIANGLNGKKKKHITDSDCFCSGSNRGPSACKADVINTTLQKLGCGYNSLFHSSYPTFPTKTAAHFVPLWFMTHFASFTDLPAWSKLLSKCYNGDGIISTLTEGLPQFLVISNLSNMPLPPSMRVMYRRDKANSAGSPLRRYIQEPLCSLRTAVRLYPPEWKWWVDLHQWTSVDFLPSYEVIVSQLNSPVVNFRTERARKIDRPGVSRCCEMNGLPRCMAGSNRPIASHVRQSEIFAVQ